MKGKTRTINSKQDAINSYALHPRRTKKLIRAMIRDAKSWTQAESALSTGDAGIVDATHRVETVTEVSELQAYDVPARGFALSVNRAAQNRYTRQLVGIQLMLDQGDINASDGVDIIDDRGIAQSVTVTELRTILSGYWQHVLLFSAAESTTRHQSELIKDPSCKLYRIGLTIKTAREIIQE